MMIAILLSVALQAPPAQKPAEKMPTVGKATEKAPPASKPETLDEQIARAMASNPDLRIAQLQVEMAKAKLDQERQRVILRITTAREAIQSIKSGIMATESERANTESLIKRSVVTKSALVPHDMKLASQRSDLAAAEAELRTAIGSNQAVAAEIPPANCPAFAKSGGKAVSCNNCHQGDQVTDGSPERLSIFVAQDKLTGKRTYHFVKLDPGTLPAMHKGFLADLPEMLERRITPDAKTGTPRELLAGLLTKAASDKPVPSVRVARDLNEYYDANKLTLTLQGDANTLSAWIEQYLDTVNIENAHVSGIMNNSAKVPNYNLYVREYGLLCVQPDQAPAGALTVAEFLEQSQAEKAARAKLAAEQAPPPKSKDSPPKAKD